jgi:hypothetical protein
MAPSVVRAQTRRRWLVVGAVALALLATPGVVAALPAGTARVAPAMLAGRIRASAGQPFEGYAVSSGTAGLPALPQLSDVSDLLNGDTRLRVWYASARRWRVDVVDTGTERDTYQLLDMQVIWDYGRSQLTEVDGTPAVRLPRGADLVPPDLARRLLAAASGDRLSPLPAKRVAGVAAAGLRITPASPHTTVGHVDIWADPGTGLPLEVAVTGKGAAAPILVTRFLDLRLGAPADAVLVPPAAREGIGYTVADSPDLLQELGQRLRPFPLPDTLAGQPRTGTADPSDNVVTYGTGLAQFVVIQVPRDVGGSAARRMIRGGGVQLDFPDGDGVLVATPLLTVLASDAHPVRRNYLIAGLVDAALLKQAGAELSSWGSIR